MSPADRAQLGVPVIVANRYEAGQVASRIQTQCISLTTASSTVARTDFDIAIAPAISTTPVTVDACANTLFTQASGRYHLPQDLIAEDLR